MAVRLTLAMQVDDGFATHRKPARRDVFLTGMDKEMPWAELCAVI